MNVQPEKFVWQTLLFSFLLLLFFPCVVAVSAFPAGSRVEFHTVNGTITFSSTLYTNSIKADNTNNRWVFQNVYMDGEKVAEWWVSTQKCVVTFTRFFKDDKLEFTVSGSGVGTVSFYVPSKPQHVTVDGKKYAGWTYDGGTKTLTLTLPLSSHKVVVFFSPVAEAFNTFRTLLGSLLLLIAIFFSVSLLVRVASGELSVMEFIWGFIGVVVGVCVLFVLLDIVEAL